jgi:hypothetical protein
MLRLHNNGISKRQTVLKLSVDKETVNRAKCDKLPVVELLKLEDPILQHRLWLKHKSL